MGCQCLQVDVLAMRSKVQRVHLQIKDICAILSGLVVAQNYKKGQQLITDRSFKVRPWLACPRMSRLVLVTLQHLCKRMRRMTECCPPSIMRLSGIYICCCISSDREQPRILPRTSHTVWAKEQLHILSGVLWRGITIAESCKSPGSGLCCVCPTCYSA